MFTEQFAAFQALLSTGHSPELPENNFNWIIVFIRLVWGHVCEGLFGLLTNIGWPRLLQTAPFLWSWGVYES